MKIKKQFRNLKTGAKRLFVGMLILSLVCTCTGIGSLFAYAEEEVKPLSHNFGGWQSDGEGGHFRVCTDEGCSETDGIYSHNYSWVDNGDGTESNTCVDCGYVSEIRNNENNNDQNNIPEDTLHEHSYSYTTNSDGTHTVTCESCDYSETESCDFGEPVTNEDGTATKTCSKCGYQITEASDDSASEASSSIHVHDFTWKYIDEEGHALVCSVCNEVDNSSYAAHHVDPDAKWEPESETGTGYHVKKCVECGEVAAREECTFNDEGICTVCGGTKQTPMLLRSTAHSLNDVIFDPISGTDSVDTVDFLDSGDSFSEAYTLTYNGQTLEKDVDYTVTYDSGADDVSSAGQNYTITYTGIGLYYGTVTKTINVREPGLVYEKIDGSRVTTLESYFDEKVIISYGDTTHLIKNGENGEWVSQITVDSIGDNSLDIYVKNANRNHIIKKSISFKILVPLDSTQMTYTLKNGIVLDGDSINYAASSPGEYSIFSNPFTLKYRGNELVAGEDYTVETDFPSSNPIAGKNYTLTYKGNESKGYRGTLSKYSISIDNPEITFTGNYADASIHSYYLTASLQITDGYFFNLGTTESMEASKTYTEFKEYSDICYVKKESNTYYFVKEIPTFSIVRKPINDASISFDRNENGSFTYISNEDNGYDVDYAKSTSTDYASAFILHDNIQTESSNMLVKDTDYTVEISSLPTYSESGLDYKVGDKYEIRYTGIGKYTGTATKYITVSDPVITYDGGEKADYYTDRVEIKADGYKLKIKSDQSASYTESIIYSEEGKNSFAVSLCNKASNKYIWTTIENLAIGTSLASSEVTVEIVDEYAINVSQTEKYIDFSKVIKYEDAIKVYYNDNGTKKELKQGEDGHYTVIDPGLSNVVEAPQNGQVYPLVLNATGKAVDGKCFIGTRNVNIKVNPVSVGYANKDDNTYTDSPKSVYVDGITLKSNNDDYEIGRSTTNFNSDVEYNVIGNNQNVVVYFKYTGNETTHIIKQTLTGINIITPVVMFDGKPTMSSYYYSNVELTVPGFKIVNINPIGSTIINESCSSYLYDVIGNNQSLTISVKEESGIYTETLTLPVITGLNIKQYFDIPVQFNGSNWKEWFKENVSITAEGYRFSIYGTDNYKETYTVTAEGENVVSLAAKKISDNSVPSGSPYDFTINIDKTAPTGKIVIDGLAISDFADSSSIVKKVDEGTEISITGEDTLSGVDHIMYFISETFYSNKNTLLSAVPISSSSKWSIYNDASKPTIKANDKNYIYVAIFDKAGNVTYISSGLIGCDHIGSTGQITVGDYTSTEFKTEEDAGKYLSSSKKVIIGGANTVCGIARIDYYIGEKYYSSPEALEAAVNNSWIKYSASSNIMIEKDKVSYVYARITDNFGGTLYLSTVAFIYDSKAPVIDNVSIQPNSANNEAEVTLTVKDTVSGVKDIKMYYAVKSTSVSKLTKSDILAQGKSLKFEVSEEGLATAKGTAVNLLTDKIYSFFFVAVDKTGNVSEITSKELANGITAADGKIEVADYTSTTFKTTDSIELSLNTPEKITISGNSNTVGVKNIEYIISDSYYGSTSEIEQLNEGSSTWKKYNDSSKPVLIQNKKNYIYARITDNLDTQTYLSTGAIIYDTLAPILGTPDITPTSDSTGAVITVSANDMLSKVDFFKTIYVEKTTDMVTPSASDVMVSGTEIKVTSESEGTSVGSTTLEALTKNKIYVVYVIAVDKAGNISEVVSKEYAHGLTAATGSITIDDYKSTSFQTTDTDVLFTNTSKKATITAGNSVAGIKSIEYYVSDTYYATTEDLNVAIKEKNSAWKTYSSSLKPETVKDKKNYIYAKITDNSGSISYLSTGAIVYDTVSPKFTTFTVGDGNEATSKIVVFGGKDTMSGVNRFKLMYKEKTSDKMTPPDKEEIFNNGIYVETKSTSGEEAASSYTITDLESGKAYVFFGAAVDRAGNISEISSQETSGTTSSSSGSGSSSSSTAGNKSGTSSLTPAPNGIAGGGNSGGGAKGGNSSEGNKSSTKQTTTDRINNTKINREPYISNATGHTMIGAINTSGWNKITSEIKKADNGAVISVEMAGLSNVPDTLLDNLQSREDVEVRLQMADDVEWSIQGSDVKADGIKNVDLGVTLGSKNIPQQILNDVVGTYPHVEFSINYDGELGFTATISVPVGINNAGMNATLYYYDAEKKELQQTGTSIVDSLGFARFSMTHCSDYTVVLSTDKLITDSGLYSSEITEATTDVFEGTKIRITDFFGISGSGRIWLFSIAIISAVLSGFILFLPSFQRKDDFDIL
ncbi:MAG: hypothetical protein IJR29_09885 [Butyrivibrio sp.]|nr:hypothetical protein [Butyrivibrio sp.]